MLEALLRSLRNRAGFAAYGAVWRVKDATPVFAATDQRILIPVRVEEGLGTNFPAGRQTKNRGRLLRLSGGNALV